MNINANILLDNFPDVDTENGLISVILQVFNFDPYPYLHDPFHDLTWPKNSSGPDKKVGPISLWSKMI